MFIGGDFAWFTAIVEDINDPEKLNRVKVRCHGWHTDDTGILKTSDLPWATVMMPSTSASFKGIGSNHELVVGSFVVGFFRDGSSGQDPIIMGSIATQTDGTIDIPTEAQKNPPTNKVHKTEAGHKIELDNTSGSEKINIEHKTGTTINIAADGTVFVNASNTTVDITGNTTIHGNLRVNGTTHSTGDVSTDAGNAPTLATHKHIEVPGTGGATSPTPAQQLTSIPDESIT
jgi:hypothetical protein